MTATEHENDHTMKGTAPTNGEETPVAPDATTTTNTEGVEAEVPTAEETHEEFMEETGRSWSRALRQRIRNGWERTKRFGRRMRRGIKNGSVKTGHGVVRGTKATGRGAKKAGEAIAVAILALLYGLGLAVFWVCYLVLQAVAYIALGIALVCAVLLGGAAALVAYAAWLVLKLIWMITLALATPWYARKDRREKKNPLIVPEYRVRTRWHVWRSGMRPGNWHKISFNALREAALKSTPPRDTEQGGTAEDGQVRAENTRGPEDPKGRPTPSRPTSHRRRNLGDFAEGTA